MGGGSFFGRFVPKKVVLLEAYSFKAKGLFGTPCCFIKSIITPLFWRSRLPKVVFQFMCSLRMSLLAFLLKKRKQSQNVLVLTILKVLFCLDALISLNSNKTLHFRTVPCV